MRLLKLNLPACLVLSLVVGLLASRAAADVLNFKVTNGQPDGGFSHTPVWLGIHDGTFDTFDAGAAASSDIEAVAELGNTGPITTTFTGMGPQTTLPGPAGAFTPGAMASVNIDIANPATNRYLSFLSMVVPSNDLFLGNGDPLAHELFDAGGNFLGPQTITILGADVWDAGTEVNDITDGAAFVVGIAGTDGTDENGVIALFLSDPGSGNYLASILGTPTAAGYDVTELFGAQDVIATIEITAVPEPSTLALVAIGVAAALAFRRRVRGKS
jgi:hypothetical protein